MKRHNGMVATVECVDPTLAETWLKSRIKNRPLSNLHIARLAETMQGGDWELNGQPIVLDRQDKLIDGQHRLSAIIRSGCTITSLVVKGAMRRTFDTYDVGRGRSAADVLSIIGVRNAVACAAVIRWVSIYEAGILANVGTGVSTFRPKLANRKVIQLYNRYPDIADSTSIVCSYGKTELPDLAPVSVLGFCHWLFRQDDLEKANLFFDSFARGLGLSEGDPIYALRTKLRALRKKMLQMATNMPPTACAALIIKTWNAYRENRSLTPRTLYWRGREPHKERFPLPIGIEGPREAGRNKK